MGGTGSTGGERRNARKILVAVWSEQTTYEKCIDKIIIIN
jgi:hypothetical protein